MYLEQGTLRWNGNVYLVRWCPLKKNKYELHLKQKDKITFVKSFKTAFEISDFLTISVTRKTK